ncbi:MAG: hypothetical protein FWG68_12725 [Defluviitaleaceae bacterium]|nr:hypothetical protein [Defluviitaleaceae bacterium]
MFRGKSCWFNLNYLSNDKRLIKANHDEERFQFSFAEELENSPYYEFVTNEEDGKETPICKVQLDLTTKSVMPQIQIHSKDRRTDDEPYKGSIYLSPIKQLIFATLPETQGYYPYKVRFNKYEEMYRYKLMDRFIEGEFTSPKGNYYKKGSFQNNFVNIFPVNTEIHEHIDVERTYRCRRV